MPSTPRQLRSTNWLYRERDDYSELGKLVELVCSRPGGYAYAKVYSSEATEWREL
jgi:hypothetical protein